MAEGWPKKTTTAGGRQKKRTRSRRKKTELDKLLKSATSGLDSMPGLDETDTVDIGYLGVRGGVRTDPETGEIIGVVPGSYTTLKPFTPEISLERLGLLPGANIPATARVQRPLYLEGDEYRPYHELSLEEVIDLQKKLDEAGLYDPSDEYILGVWDDVDSQAYRRLLIGANRAGQTAQERLQFILSQPPEVRRQITGREKPPLVITLTSAEDMSQIVDAVTREVFGRNVKLPPRVKETLLATFNDIEREAQMREYNLREVQHTTSQISPAAFVQAELERMYPYESKLDEFNEAMDAVLQGLFGQ